MKNILFLLVCCSLLFTVKGSVSDSLAIDSVISNPLDEIIEDIPVKEILDTKELLEVTESDSTTDITDDVQNIELEEEDDIVSPKNEMLEDTEDGVQTEDIIELDSVKENVSTDIQAENTVVEEELDLEQIYTNINMLNKKYFKWGEGSIRNLLGEMIVGKLKFYNKYKSCRKVKFVNADGEQKAYRARKLEGYTRGVEDFDTKKVRALMFGSKRYVRVLVSENGVSLYRYYYRNRVLMFPVTWRGDRFATGGHAYYGTFVRYYVEKGGEIKKLGQRKYKTHLAEIFPNCSETTSNVKDKYFMYGDHDMTSIVKDYLHCVE